MDHNMKDLNEMDDYMNTNSYDDSKINSNFDKILIKHPFIFIIIVVAIIAIPVITIIIVNR